MNRSIAVFGALVLILVGGLYWKMSADTSSPNVPPTVASSDTGDGEPAGKTEPKKDVVPSSSVAKSVAKTTEPPESESDGVSTFEIGSDVFTHKVDVVIGDKFRAFGAFKCDESGIDPDGKVRVNYIMRIKDGQVSATNIKAVGERGAEKLARCIEDSMQNATFSMPRMPDFEEEHDLFIRVKTLKKYRSRAEFDD